MTTSTSSRMTGAFAFFAAGALVGGLAWQGKLASMMGFAPTFAIICLVFGLLSLRGRPRVNIWGRTSLIVLGSALAFGGGLGQYRLAERTRVANQAAAVTALGGRPAGALAGLVPVNVDADVLADAASFRRPVTIVTFWARWCSPCRRELPELNEFYEAHRSDGLAVVAVTKFDGTEEDDRAGELEAARRFADKLELTFPVAIASDESVHVAYAVRSLPSVALIDERGVIIAYGVGVEGGRDVMKVARGRLER